MPTFYNYTEGGQVYSFDDVFVPADTFRQGGLWTWGSNYNAELGVNDTTDRITPVTTSAGGANWKSVSSRTAHTAAIKTDGTLWTWGYNSFGQLGINSAGTANSRTTPVTTFLGGTNWKFVACGRFHTLAIKTDGTLWGWGWPIGLGINDGGNRSTPVTTFLGGTNWKSVSCGQYHTAAIKTDGTLWTWGSNSKGQLGINGNSTAARITPVTTFLGGTNWKSVACGWYHTSAIKTDGTLWTWGLNSYGQLGINNTDDRSIPVQTFLGGTNWKSVAYGLDNTAAIKTDGTLWTWGDNAYLVAGGGQLGINNITQTMVCTPVTTFAGGTNWKQVAYGFKHAAALTYIDSYL